MTSELPYYKGPKTPEHETPQWLFDELDQEFHFTVDVCANERNHKCNQYYGSGGTHQDGLSVPWHYGRCWMNPPYGREITKWVKKAYEESQEGTLVVGLLPARTDTRWFHDYIYHKAEIRFLKGRLKFSNNKPAPFPSMVVIWRGSYGK